MNKNLSKLGFVLLFLCFNIHCSTSLRPKIYVLAFMDTDAKGANNVSIGKYFGEAEERIRYLVRDIAANNNVETKLIIYKGDNFKIQKLLEEFKKMPKFSNNDVLICYVGCHGSKYTEKNTDFRDYPNLHFKEGKINGLDIHNTIKGKNAGLTITLLEACAALTDNRKVEKLGTKAQGDFSKLFLQTKGDMVFAATKPDTYACIGTYGGVFSNAWFDAIKNEAIKENPSWYAIKTNTQKGIDYVLNNSEEAREQCGGQTIVAQINIK